MPERPVRRRLVRLLGSLPVIAHFARRLELQAIIDQTCPSRGNAQLTHGQVALAIIANRLTQPNAMYQLLRWAQQWGVREVFGFDPAQLNDDRLGRCLDALAPQINPIQGAVTVAAIREFDLDLSQLHGDLTSVVLQGEYPAEEQHRDYPQPAYGFGGEPNCKPLRVGELVTHDGGVPIGHRSSDGNPADVGTAVAQMEALRAHVALPECLVIGDSKLLSARVSEKLRRQQLHFLAPLPKSAELDAEFLALDAEGWEPLDYVAKRQERLAPEERTQYQGQEVAWEWVDPQRGTVETFRRLFVISSEEQATCRKVRAQQMAKAEAELAKIAAGLGKRQLKTAAQVQARVERVLAERRVIPLYQVTVSEIDAAVKLTWVVDAEARSRAEALEGSDVLLTSIPGERADRSALLRMWKQESQIERRFSDWQGPLRVRPVFVTSNARMAALVWLLHLALMLYCLLEREARRQLAAKGRQKVFNLLAGHVDAVPTGGNILRAFEHLFLIIEEQEHGREYAMSEFSLEQAELWRLLGIQELVWAEPNQDGTMLQSSNVNRETPDYPDYAPLPVRKSVCSRFRHVVNNPGIKVANVSVFERPAPFSGIPGGFVIVVRGPSSSGKSTLMATFADLAATPWIRFDETCVGDLPLRFAIWPEASGPIGEGFLAALPAIARAGNQIITSAGGFSEKQFRSALTGIPSLFVRLECPLEVLVARQQQRVDRWAGLAEETAREGDDWSYDLRIDTSVNDPIATARILIEAVGKPSKRQV